MKIVIKVWDRDRSKYLQVPLDIRADTVSISDGHISMYASSPELLELARAAVAKTPEVVVQGSGWLATSDPRTVIIKAEEPPVTPPSSAEEPQF